MEEIITKGNLDTYTLGLKGVLSSMGLEIDDKAGSSAVNAVGAKVDTVDGKCDLILTAVGSGSGDVDYGLFVTKEWLLLYLTERNSVPRLYFDTNNFVDICYTTNSGSSRTTNYRANELSENGITYKKPILIYKGDRLYGGSLTKGGSPSSGNRYIIKNNRPSWDTNYTSTNSENIYYDLDENFSTPVLSGFYYSSNTTSGFYNLLVSNTTTAFAPYLCPGIMKILKIEMDGQEINDISIKIKGHLLKNDDVFYTNDDDYLNDPSIYEVPIVDGYLPFILSKYNYVTISLYQPDTVADNILYKVNTANYKALLPSPSSSTSADYTLQAKNIEAIEKILANTHKYGGVYNSGTMQLKQISDTDETKYVDGTDVDVSENTYIFKKFPEFYVKYVADSTVEFFIDPTGETTPSGNDWIKYGEDLIGEYVSDSNKFTSYNHTVNGAYASTITQLYNTSSNGFTLISLKEIGLLNALHLAGYTNILKTPTENYNGLCVPDMYLTKGSTYWVGGGILNGVTTNISSTANSNWYYKYYTTSSSSAVSLGYAFYFTYSGSTTSTSSSSSNYSWTAYLDTYTTAVYFRIRIGGTYFVASSSGSHTYIKYTGPYTIID